MVSVLFVCLGNICRSPMAEAIFRKLVNEAGLEEQIKIESAGTGDWHIGSPPHQGTCDILDRYQIDYSGQTARQLNAQDFQQFTHIVCMDRDNVRDALTFANTPYPAHVRLMLDYVPEEKRKDVPDPYFTGDFQMTYDLLRVACERLLADIVHNK